MRKKREMFDNSNNNAILFKMNEDQLRLVKTSLALTLSAIVRTQKEAQDKISLDQNALESLYLRFEHLQIALEDAIMRRQMEKERKKGMEEMK